MNILKISTLKDAKRSKVNIKKEQKHTPEPKPQPPLILAMALLPDTALADKLLSLVHRYPGNRPLELHIKSKLADVIIESKMSVSDMILDEAKELGVYLEESLTPN
jgi:DNA polymerase-3 subunit alpha